jgi:hypothetical protein
MIIVSSARAFDTDGEIGDASEFAGPKSYARAGNGGHRCRDASEPSAIFRRMFRSSKNIGTRARTDVATDYTLDT